MGNSAPSSKLEEATQRAGDRIGQISIKGRYHRLPKRLTDAYELTDKTLGSGYNGAVHQAKSLETGQKFAVKAFKLHGVSKEKMKELVTEAEIFLGMDHPHVARLVDVFEEEEALSLVMECMEGGELFDRVTARKVFSEQDAAEACHQMLLAVNYIHSCGVVHRDLKLENFLYEKKDNDFLKLIDFGFSKIWDKNVKMEISCGTLSYVAPEVLNKSYTSQCDMWSLGVIVFILLAGYMPFKGSSERQQTLAIKNGAYHVRKERWDRVSASAFDFVQKLLVVDPEVRLTAPLAMEHPWIVNRAECQERRQSKLDTGIAESLCAFARGSQFRRTCMHLMAWSLTAEERSEVRGAFLELDTSHTGTVPLSDLRHVLEAKFHVAENESLEVLKALDSNGDDEINYTEFLAAMLSSRIVLHDEHLKATFRRFDVDNTGFITPEDLKQVIGAGCDIDAIMKQVDLNHDGKISTKEFIAYLRNVDVQDRHGEAIGKLIDQQLEGADLHEPGSPVRLRKRDKLRLFAQRIGLAKSDSGSPGAAS